MIADQAIAEAPQSPFAFHVRGKAFLASNDFKKAAEDLLTAYSLYNYRAKLHLTAMKHILVLANTARRMRT